MSRQILSLNDERTNKYMIQLKMMFSTLMRKKLPLKIKVHPGEVVQLHADKILNLNISKSRINFKSSGELNTNKKIELHANQIKKHQLSLLNCGGNAEFEVDDFFKQQFADINNIEEFRNRIVKISEDYNPFGYDLETVRINHELVSSNYAYMQYKDYMDNHEFLSSLFGVSSIPGTTKEIY